MVINGCKVKSMKVYDINIVIYHTFCRSAGMSPQPELGPDKYQGSLHSRDGPSHDTILWQENLNLGTNMVNYDQME